MRNLGYHAYSHDSVVLLGPIRTDIKFYKHYHQFFDYFVTFVSFYFVRALFKNKVDDVCTDGATDDVSGIVDTHSARVDDDVKSVDDALALGCHGAIVTAAAAASSRGYPLLPVMTLSISERILAYREAAAYLLRSAEEMERYLLQHL